MMPVRFQGNNQTYIEEMAQFEMLEQFNFRNEKVRELLSNGIGVDTYSSMPGGGNIASPSALPELTRR